MPPNTHRILRQILELDLGASDRPMVLQQTAARVWQTQGLATLEAVFDRWVGPHQQVRLDRLELDLGRLQGPDWPQQFSRQLEHQLIRQLEQVVPQTPTPDGPNPEGPNPDTPDPEAFEQLLYFCQQGRLPWWGSRPRPPWLDTLETTLTPAQWHRLAALMHHDRRACRRLIYTATDGFLQTLVQQVTGIPGAQSVLEQWQPVIPVGPLTAPTAQSWREPFWITVLGACGHQAQGLGPPLIRQLWGIRQSLLSPHRPAPLGDNALPDSSPPLRLPSPWQTWVEQAQVDPQPSPGRSPVPSSPNQTQRSEAAAIPEATHGAPPPSSTDPSPTPGNQGSEPDRPDPPPETFPQAADAQGHIAADRPAQSDPVVPYLPLTPTSPESWPGPHGHPQAPGQALGDTDDIYGPGAGLVIVHPFLPELFDSLGVWRDRQFANPQAQRRAVALLTYLAFGDRPVPEYDLLLPKLLAAWPWAEPLPPQGLSDRDRQACDQLLSAVLQHWQALRSSSADWLRETFFWRDGKFTPVDGGWRLTIERHAQDVLLNRLPWGLGVIYLPWMTEVLHVSWLS